MTRQIVHIGQRKTGSTWLQEIFREAALAGQFAYEREDLWRWHRKHDWKTATPGDYAELTDILAAYHGQNAVISLEGLSMRPPEAVIEAVKAGLPDAIILMVTRNPKDYLVSSFNNSIISGKIENIEAFADKFAGHLKRSHDLVGWKAACDTQLGENRIRFVPYEMLGDDPHAFLREISDIIGVDLSPFFIETNRNASPPDAVLELLRRINISLHETPHPLSDMREWNALRYVLTNATGYATELHGFFNRYLEHFDVTFEMPEMPEKLRKLTLPRMKLLRPRALYAPYLECYGFVAADEPA